MDLNGNTGLLGDENHVIGATATPIPKGNNEVRVLRQHAIVSFVSGQLALGLPICRELPQIEVKPGSLLGCKGVSSFGGTVKDDYVRRENVEPRGKFRKNLLDQFGVRPRP